MSEQIFEMFDALYKTAHRQGRQIEELLTRVTELERCLRERNAEAESYAARPVLHIVEPEEQPCCPRCEKHHSMELPCVPVEEAWAKYGEEVQV